MSGYSERQAGQPGDEPERTDLPEDPRPDPGRDPDPGSEPTRDGPAGTNAPAGTNGRRRRGVRVRTVVFGLVLLAISASVLVTLLTTARVDGTAVTFVVLIGAGAALVAGGLAAAVREARGGPGA